VNGIVGTAGHIDHGKTALIRALTGEETDRLPEERARGISIDLGFSHLEVAGVRLGIVDVPGHEDFIRNMLAGATGIDVLLLVVAADEGVMPQTREHAAIAQLLGVERAVVALTKADLVGDDWLGLVHDDVAGFLDGTPFASATVVPTSTVTGRGIDELRAALAAALGESDGAADDLFRMPVDRAFTVRGTGTVITGTVWSGTLTDDATVRLLPDGPECRVRGLQVHGDGVAALSPGERGAIALVGVDRDEAARGMTAVVDPSWEPTDRITARLQVLPGPQWTVEPHQRVRVHLGTAEVMARVVLLDRETLAPGQQGWVQLRLETPLLARGRDRFVIRSYSPVTTIGGGVVAEPIARRRARIDAETAAGLAAVAGTEGDPAGGLAWLLRDAGPAGVAAPRLPVLTGLAPRDVQRALEGLEAVAVGERRFDTAALGQTRESLLDAVEAHHRRHPLHSGAPVEGIRQASAADAGLVERALDGLLAEGRLVRRGVRVARKGWSARLTPAQEERREGIAGRLSEAGPEAPRVDELVGGAGDAAEVHDLLALLEEEGRVVRVEHDLFLDAGVAERIVAAVRTRLGGREGLSPGDFRDVMDVSRKHLMPLLAWLDRAGVTVRGPTGRAVPG
jgi:selenocysteine-specific elongation factor